MLLPISHAVDHMNVPSCHLTNEIMSILLTFLKNEFRKFFVSFTLEKFDLKYLWSLGGSSRRNLTSPTDRLASTFFLVSIVFFLLFTVICDDEKSGLAAGGSAEAK
jgi:hypothetical protein